MNIGKTNLGLPFFDDAVGGIYFHLPTLVRGSRDSSKDALALAFIDKVLRTGERAVFFCERQSETVLLDARNIGIDIETPLKSNQLFLVSIRDLIASSSNGRFPYENAVEELHALVSRHSIGFAVFSSVAPWLEVHPFSAIPGRVSAFIDMLGNLSLTSMLLLHKPASEPAERLATTLADSCPIIIEMDAFQHGQRELRIVKYSGLADREFPIVIPLDLVTGKGLSTISSEPSGVGLFETGPAPRPIHPSPSSGESHHQGARRRTLFSNAQATLPTAITGAYPDEAGYPHPSTLPATAQPSGAGRPELGPAASARPRKTLFAGAPQMSPPPATPAQPSGAGRFAAAMSEQPSGAGRFETGPAPAPTGETQNPKRNSRTLFSGSPSLGLPPAQPSGAGRPETAMAKEPSGAGRFETGPIAQPGRVGRFAAAMAADLSLQPGPPAQPSGTGRPETGPAPDPAPAKRSSIRFSSVIK